MAFAGKRLFMKKIRNKNMIKALLLMLILLTGLLGSASAEAPVLGAAPGGSELTGKSSAEIVGMMELGFNIGNTFDASGGNVQTRESQWGNVAVTQEFVDAIYDAGFNTVRIPITWYGFIADDGSYTINPDYLARIKEVVDYCYNDGLFVIINAHHEPWINRKDLNTAYKEVAEELNAVWAQVATYFANYDQHLIFEGMNEPRMAGTDGEWNGNADAYYAVNYLNQVFVNAVRSTGLGHNGERCLMIPGYAASSSSEIMRTVAIPTYKGQAVENLIVSVHSYTPYEFCLTDNRNNFINGLDTGSIDSVFRDIYTTFVQNGIPVVIGETGATNSGDNTEARVAWAEYTAQKAASYGIPIILWDNGAAGKSGGECHSYIKRRTNEVLFPEIFEALKRGWNSVKRGAIRYAASVPRTGGILGGRILFENPDGASSDAVKLDVKGLSLPECGTVAVVYQGESTPFFNINDEGRGAGFSAESTRSFEGYQVATFSLSRVPSFYQDLLPNAENITFSVAEEGASPYTIYEVSILGMPASNPETTYTYRVNGNAYATSKDTPVKNPTPEGFKFLGWYTSPKYTPGTEFNGTIHEGARTVYAKLELASFRPVAVSVTPAPLPVISPRSDRPMPTPTPTPSPEVTPTPTPAEAVTEQPATPTAAAETTDKNKDEKPMNPALLIIPLLMSFAIIGYGVFLVVRGIRGRKQQ